MTSSLRWVHIAGTDRAMTDHDADSDEYGPCRWCGRPAYTSDDRGWVHVCCEIEQRADCRARVVRSSGTSLARSLAQAARSSNDPSRRDHHE